MSDEELRAANLDFSLPLLQPTARAMKFSTFAALAFAALPAMALPAAEPAALVQRNATSLEKRSNGIFVCQGTYVYTCIYCCYTSDTDILFAVTGTMVASTTNLPGTYASHGPSSGSAAWVRGAPTQVYTTAFYYSISGHYPDCTP